MVMRRNVIPQPVVAFPVLATVIRIPFITEGFIQGLLGSGVAILAVTALHTWYPLHNEFQLNTSALLGTNAVVLIVGVVIGSVGSAIAIRRFLDV